MHLLASTHSHSSDDGSCVRLALPRDQLVTDTALVLEGRVESGEIVGTVCTRAGSGGVRVEYLRQ